MKNIIKISLISLITLSFLNSCRDAIDIVQDGEINNQQTFKTVADLQKYLLGDVYKTMSNTGLLQFLLYLQTKLVWDRRILL